MGGLVGLVGHAVLGADGRMQRPGIEPESHLPGVAVMLAPAGSHARGRAGCLHARPGVTALVIIEKDYASFHHIIPYLRRVLTYTYLYRYKYDCSILHSMPF